MEKFYPLSFSQQRLWFFEQLHPGTGIYNIHAAFELHGSLKIQSLRWAINEVTKRHSSLRTSFHAMDGVARQRISDDIPIDIKIHDVAEFTDEAILGLLTTQAKAPFDLSCPPLLRVTLLQKNEQHFYLLIVMHHIISDGWSLGIFNREISHLYESHAQNEAPLLSPVAMQYVEFAEHQRKSLQGTLLENHLSYWKEKLGEKLPVLNLPTDRHRPNVFTHRGSSIRKVLENPLTSHLHRFSNQNKVTPFMTLLSAFNVLLMRYSSQKDILIGTPIAGRQNPSSEELIGFFVNILMLRNDLSGDPTFLELLQRIRQTTLEAFEHQDLPFDLLVEKLHPERSLSHSSMFQVLVALQNAPEFPLEMKDVSVERLPWIDTSYAKFDWSILFSNTHSGLEMRAVYSLDLFTPTTMLRMSEHFENLLNGILKNPNTRISRLPLMGEEEYKLVVVDWNQTKTEYPRDCSIHDLFAKTMTNSPHSIAVQSGERRLTYTDLNHQADRLASQLLQKGVKHGAIIGVCLEKTPEFIVSCLAVLKTGGAYLPLDPDYPAARIELILKEANSKLVVTQTRFASKLPRYAEKILLENSTEERPVDTPFLPEVKATDLAYVIHTSGSMGKPKGVAVSHRAVIRLVRNTNYIRIDSQDVIGQTSHTSFDATAFEMWGALLNGARLVIIPQSVLLSPLDLAQKILQDGITILFLSTALFHTIIQEKPDAFQSLHTLLVGGETMNPALLGTFLEKYRPHRFMNVYGPTEGTTFTTWQLIDKIPEDGFNVPIGRPISNTTVYILDEFSQPVPISIPGEICIGGDGVAKGYINRPDLTDQYFGADPFGGSGQLLRTGDLGKWRIDGTIEFLGRADRQIKIREFLVEPGDVEAVIQQYEGIRECAVIAGHDQVEYSKFLVAYVVPAKGFQLEKLLMFLRTKLPQYMIPARIVPIDSLPLNASGKLDRNQLPAVGEIRENSSEFVGPRDALEFQLVDIWQKLLKVRPVGITENFFDLGGHSLLAIRLFAEIRKITGKDLPLATLFETPTIEGLCKKLHDQGWTPSWSSLVAIRPNGSKPALFFVHGLGGNVLIYNALAKHVAADRPFFGLQSKGLDGNTDPLWSIQEMASNYLSEIRKLQQEGPYYLGGASLGGVIAFEMACQLRKQNQQVKFLGIVDTSAYHANPPDKRNFFSRRIRSMNQFLRFIQATFSPSRTDLRLSKKEYNLKIQLNALRLALMLSNRFGLELWRRVRKVRVINRYAIQNYVPERYNGLLTLFITSAKPPRLPNKGWNNHCDELEVHPIPGDHYSMLKEPDVKILAQELTRCLDRSGESD